jgi:hypothetical protein
LTFEHGVEDGDLALADGGRQRGGDAAGGASVDVAEVGEGSVDGGMVAVATVTATKYAKLAKSSADGGGHGRVAGLGSGSPRAECVGGDVEEGLI